MGHFNAYHGIWQLIMEGVLPAHIVDRGPCTASPVPWLIVGGHSNSGSSEDFSVNKRNTMRQLADASVNADSVELPAELMCEEHFSQEKGDAFANTQIRSPLLYEKAPGFEKLESSPHISQPMYLFESPLLYRTCLRDFYAQQLLPTFLAEIVTGVKPPLRSSTDDTPLCAVIDNPEDGSGWFLCLNARYHHLSTPVSNAELAKQCFFIAWWVSPTWYHTLKSVVADDNSDALPPPALTWTPTLSISPSCVSTQLLNTTEQRDYLHTFRDLHSPQPLLNLNAGANVFFKQLGIDMSSFEVVNCHYPPSLKYGTLHVHYRHVRTFSKEEAVSHYPVAKIIQHIREKGANSFTDGSVRFFYPHHTGRSVWLAYTHTNPTEEKQYMYDGDNNDDTHHCYNYDTAAAAAAMTLPVSVPVAVRELCHGARIPPVWGMQVQAGSAQELRDLTSF
jgi:hypothetical protein